MMGLLYALQGQLNFEKVPSIAYKKNGAIIDQDTATYPMEQRLLPDYSLIENYLKENYDKAFNLWYAQHYELKRMVTLPCYPHEIHIDGILVFIDKDLAIVHPPDLDFAPAVIKDLESGEVREQMILDFFESEGVETIAINEEERDAAAANWVMTAPRQIVGYEWADRVMNEVEKRGGKAIGVPGTELIKGNGGPHCMTCPLER